MRTCTCAFLALSPARSTRFHTHAQRFQRRARVNSLNSLLETRPSLDAITAKGIFMRGDLDDLDDGVLEPCAAAAPPGDADWDPPLPLMLPLLRQSSYEYDDEYF